MKKKFSEGNWSVEEDASYNGIHFIWCESELSHIPKLVARTCFAPDSIANARLIAAAPELLEACMKALEHHQGAHSEIGFILRDAIKKATE